MDLATSILFKRRSRGETGGNATGLTHIEHCVEHARRARLRLTEALRRRLTENVD